MADDAQGLVGTSWRPIEIAGEPVADDNKSFLAFEEGAVSGHGGCNRMGGSYEADKASLKIGPLRATRMACPPDIMAVEGAFGKALETTRLYLRNDEGLTLKDAQGVTTMRLVPNDAG